MAFNIVVDPNNVRGPVAGGRKSWTGGPIIAMHPTNNWTDAGIVHRPPVVSNPLPRTTGLKSLGGHFMRGLFGGRGQ